MIDYLDVGAVRVGGGSGSRELTLIDGLFGTPGVRGNVFDRPEAHGVVEPVAQYMTARLVVVEGEVWGSTVADAYSEFGVVDGAYRSGLSGYVTVGWRPEGGSVDVQGSARLVGPVVPRLSAGDRGPRLVYQAQLRFTDPAWYSQASSSVSVGAAASSGGMPYPLTYPIPYTGGTSGGTLSVTNAGDVVTWPTLTVAGPINGPVVGCVTTGEYLAFPTLNLADGQTLVVETNPQGRSATVAGVNVQGAVQWVSSVWPSAPVGTSTWSFYSTAGGTTGATTFTVAWRSAYMTPA